MKLRLMSFFTGLLGFSVPSFAVPLIHEVFYDAEGSDAAHVFTEIAGLPGTRLDGYRLVGIDGASGLVYRQIDLTGALIPEDGLLVIATARALGDLLLVRDFIAENNPPALAEMAARFREAIDRGLWAPRTNSAYDRLSALIVGVRKEAAE